MKNRIKNANSFLVKASSLLETKYFFGNGKMSHFKKDRKGDVCYYCAFQKKLLRIDMTDFDNNWLTCPDKNFGAMLEWIRDYIVDDVKIPKSIIPIYFEDFKNAETIIEKLEKFSASLEMTVV